MIDIKISSGDIAIESFDIALVSGVDFIAQRLQTALQLFRNEWFLDILAGVPYHEVIFKKNPNIASVRAALRETILSVAGVKEITKLETSLNASTRVLTADFRVDTTEGSISLGAILA